MCSQSGNFQHLAAYSGQPRSYMIGSEPEPDSSHRQDFGHPPSQPSDMGLRYMTVSAPDDARFNSHTGNSHSPVFPIESSTPNSANYSPLVNLCPPSLSGSSVLSTNSGSNYYSPASTYSMSDVKSRLGSISSLSSSMAPPTQSPAIPHLRSPANTRDMYSGATPQLRRTDILGRSPPTTNAIRVMPIPPSASFAPPSGMDLPVPPSSQSQSPPLQPTVNLLHLQTTDGLHVRPEISGKIDKGFFMADGDWTCYRRNYFSLQCSFSVHPHVAPTVPLLLVKDPSNLGSAARVCGFAMCIAAVADNYNGKAIDLVQHTAKRDKGPQNKPSLVPLDPRPPPSFASGHGDGSIGYSQPSMYEQRLGQAPGQNASEATFERIQFKQATANNGKRRAAQQYYHLLVELFVDTGHMERDRWHKVAYRMSEQMVVRGRSPGHYQSEKREPNASSGPGSQGGGGGGGSYGGGVRPGEQISMSGSSTIISGNYSAGGYEHRGNQYTQGNSLNTYELPVEPIMSSEEAKAIDEIDGYQYYPSALHEGHVSNRQTAAPVFRDERPTELPSRPLHDYSAPEPKHKNEYTTSFSLPSLTTGPIDTFNRHCGRFEGASSSRGYYPLSFHQSEVDTS